MRPWHKAPIVDGKEANLLVELFRDIFAGKDKQPALEHGVNMISEKSFAEMLQQNR